jgi:hypothetical protein
MKDKNRQQKTHSPGVMLTLWILCVLLSACGSGGGSDGGVGSVAFDFMLARTASNSTSAQLQPLQAEFACEENGVETIEAQVLDENSVVIAEGGPWQCTDGEGSLSDVQAGDNRIVKIIARNSEGDILYAGRSEPFTIRSGETTVVDTIELQIAAFNPVTKEDSAITSEDRAVTIAVLGNDPDTYYNTSGDYFGTLDPTTVTVVVEPSRGETEVNVDGSVRYTPDPNFNGEDFFRYTVQDDRGVTSDETPVTVTVNDAPDAPEAPAEVTATPGVGQISLDWLSVADATTYNVYFSNESGVTKNNFDGVFRGIGQTSFIHTNLAGGDTFFYVVTAQNDIGEGDASAEVSATVPVNSRLIGNFKGTGFGSDPWTVLFDADFDGSGNGDYQENANSDSEEVGGTYTYDLDADGSLTATLSTGVEFSGILNAGNNIFAVADTDFGPPDFFIEMDVGIKKSTGLTDAILNGDYIGVRISGFDSTALLSATFDGDGTGSFEFLEPFGSEAPTGFTYSIESDGSATFDNLSANASAGIVREDGTVVTIVDTDASDDDEISMIIFIKTSAGLSNATLSGDYIGVSYGLFIGEGIEEETSVASISADGAGNIAFEILSNSSGIGSSFNTAYDSEGIFNANYNVDSGDGRITISLPNDEVYEGVVNADGEIFNYVNWDSSDSFIEVGVVIRKAQ